MGPSSSTSNSLYTEIVFNWKAYWLFSPHYCCSTTANYTRLHRHCLVGGYYATSKARAMHNTMAHVNGKHFGVSVFNPLMTPAVHRPRGVVAPATAGICHRRPHKTGDALRRRNNARILFQYSEQWLLINSPVIEFFRHTQDVLWRLAFIGFCCCTAGNGCWLLVRFIEYFYAVTTTTQSEYKH